MNSPFSDKVEDNKKICCSIKKKMYWNYFIYFNVESKSQQKLTSK